MIPHAAKKHEDPNEDWDDAQRRLFSRVFRLINENQELVKHPETEELPEDQWQTIAWNAAYFAAHSMANGKLFALTDDDGNVYPMEQDIEDMH